jgi:hypothetical protein
LYQKIARVATIALVLICSFLLDFTTNVSTETSEVAPLLRGDARRAGGFQIPTAHAGYNFWKWLNFGSDKDSTDFTVAFDNRASTVPTFVSPTDGGYTADTTPTLSANYIDVDVGDVGTTDYRIALSAFGCRSNTSVVTSGASSQTTTISETTTWTVTSALTTDGTYFWCASNNDGVLSSNWVSGTGNGWTFILDTTAPTTSAAITAGTEGNDSWYTDNVTVTLTPADSSSGVDTTVYCKDQTNECTPTSNYSTPITVATEGTNYVRYFSTDNVANAQSVQSLTVKVDKSNPAGGSISFTDGYETDTTLAVTVAPGTDSVSGMSSDNSEYVLEYALATLAAGSCGQYGDWTDASVSETAAGTAYNFTSSTGNCYKLRYTVTDVASNTATYTSESVTKVDTTTPDIVAADAGASSGDRVSFTSATWFSGTDVGGDDAASFSWTDAASASDDTFYYELNATATATVTGDESTATTAYIDSITVAEGTNYFHVRPRNGAATWGTERIFTVKYDETNPTTAVTIAETNYGTDFNHTSTINGTAADATAGVSSVEIKLQESSTNNYWTGSAWSASETWVAVTAGTTTWTYTIIDEDNFTHTRTYTITARATDGAGNVTASSFGSDSFSYNTGNDAPSVPTLVSPANASFTTDATPTLSANYIDTDEADVGTTNYRISSGTAQNCLDSVNIVSSGTSAETSTNSEATTYTPASSISSDGTYYWCAQNDDGSMTSAWTSMANFILDTAAPDLTDLELTSNETYFEDAGIPVTSGLVGYWKLDEASWAGTADEVLDYSGNANHGVRGGNATTATGGKFKKAGTFDGTTDYVNVGEMAAVKNQSGLTISAWVNPTTFSNWSGLVAQRNSTSDYTPAIELLSGAPDYGGNTALFARVNTATDSYGYTSAGALSAGSWQYVTMVFDGSGATNSDRLKIYVDGQNKTLTFSGTIPATTNSPAGNLNIGAIDYSSYAYVFDGLIDDVAVYNRAITQTEVTNIYTKRLAYFNSLAAEGSGQTITVTTAATEDNPTSWLCASAFGDAPSADTSSPYTQAYGVETDAATQTDKTCTFTDDAGQTSATSITYTQDNVDPISGSVSHTDTPQTSTTIAVTVAAGTDATSGLSVSASDFLLEQRNATATNGSCGSYGSWTNAAVTETANATSYDFTATSGKCYQFRYTVTDKVANATTYTSSNTTIVDATTPDIVAADAGASSGDRVSLTSDTWIIYTGTGSDDKLSFSWTDPASPSDDTFYYELNATATATVTGDESTVAVAYVDEVSITEGTKYFHVRPKNTAGTWGTERIFIVKYDKVAPATGSTSHADGYQNTTTIAVTVAPGTDAGSGMSTTNGDYTLEQRNATLAAGSCGSYGGWTNAAVSETYNATAYNFTATTAKCYQFRYTVKDTAQNSTTYTSSTTTKVDTTAPSTPTLSYTNGFTATSPQNVTFASTDGESTVASLTLYYRSATLTAGSCGSYGSWSSLGAQTSPYSHALTTAKCYMYKVTATNGSALATTKDDNSEVTKYDSATPDIVAADAGASSGDRVSLTSNTWFKYTDTGSDDAVSFSWTDPVSASNDTFYYELNATATATVTGDESTVATPYIDSISLTEGTAYFHVRPRNASATWGTERIFIMKYDKTVPTTSAAVTAGTEGDASWYTTNATVTITPADATSGIASTVYCTDTANTCTPGTAYTVPLTISTEDTNYVRYFSTDNISNIQSTQSLTVKVDKTAPATGSTVHTDGYETDTTLAVTVSPGTDATSGLSTVAADYLLEQRNATLAADTCGTYGSWTNASVTEAYDATSYDFTSTSGKCYQFRYTVTDNAGLTTTYTSDDTTKVDTTTPDIVAADAGASSADRVSLTSGTWIVGADVGGDDKVSFSWTDPSSASDDTFYYELNATATATVTGNETTASTPYIDSITLTEGTAYFHVRPRNGASTWGTERIFIVKYDETAPATGSVAHTEGYENDLVIAVTVNRGSDATSGMSATTGDYLLEFRSATLTLGVCATYGNWNNANVTETTTGTDYNFTSASGNCYQLRYSVKDIAGNQAIYTSDDTTKVDTVVPNVVAIDAGASSADRVSLTSGTWFKASDVGDDDIASYSWTDPSSASEDSFYRDYVDAGLVSWWQFDNEWNDSANSNNGTAAGGVTFTSDSTGKIVNAASFDGDDDYVTLDENVAVTAAAFWFNPTAVTSDTILFGSAGSHALQVNSSGNWQIWDGSAHAFSQGPALGSWHHYAFTYDGTNYELYKDGAYQAEVASDQITIGMIGRASAGATIDGLIDEVKIWNRALSAADVAAEYAQRVTIATPYFDTQTLREGDGEFHVRPISGAGNWGIERTFDAKYDETNPTVQTDTVTSPNGGEIWTGGDGATYDITWTSADFTDATAGLTATPITIDYSVDSGSNWTQIATGEVNDGTYTWTTPDLTDEEVQVRITAVDQAGNSANDTSDADFRLSAYDNWIALHISEGNNQFGDIDATLPTNFKTRVGNGADSGETYAGADVVTVTFTIATAPASPTAVGQSLANGTFGTTFGGTSTAKTVTTDASGYTSVVTTLGDRAGDYTVIGSFTNVETAEADRTFTATEREVFKFTISDPILEIDVNPLTNAAASDSTTLSVTTNAASYQINVDPNAWPTYDEENINNWSGGLGFGWDNNGAGTSGGTSTTSAFDGLDTPTDAYVCSGDTCQGLKEFTLDFHTAVDFSYEAGTYENIMTVEGANISF